MDVKGKVLLQLFNKRKLRNGTKKYLEQNFSLFIIKFKKLGFSVRLIICKSVCQMFSAFFLMTLPF